MKRLRPKITRAEKARRTVAHHRRAAFLAIHAHLSLLRNRAEHAISWGEAGLPTLADVDESLSAASRLLYVP